ncbi:RagB/SusD family nutrient uptake outer membrane protein [Chitinophaga caeni]|uniref:RagB/SusD family nutrient uptake outer membrane protein n=1 Tax=Chitinophaga caeni TaxID=2029983 RepID=A0A291QZK3_9BACT|nr:RagB/SusD family nutrient uptake outer membrane protein [Chitinophaga caeni]ATL49273.1 RagB/SusD family nutrient uptake outer membrane protein [Chitinophaga caeni]
MKRIIIIMIAAVSLVACNKFLDTENLTEKDTSNYPGNQDEVNNLLTGVYAAARAMEMDENARCAFVVGEVLSDDRFGGGGPDDKDWANLEKFVLSDPNMFRDTWSNAYRSIFRVNMLLRSLDMITWDSEASRSYVEGQAYFLRAYSYFYLAKLFGTAPLVLSPDPENLPRASADELFGQIAADLKMAIEKMPNTPKVAERGRASKWAAEALMGRAYLFYSGYYKNETINLPGGGTMGKTEVVNYLDDCITHSGYDLYPDFRNLWPYSNLLSKRDGYPYSIDNDLQWAGESGGNYETIFAFQNAAKVTWDNVGDCNRINLYFSPREQDEAGIFPYGKGWGFGPVNPQLWNNWPQNDPRKKGSIIDVTDADNEMPAYQWAADHQQHESGLWQKKYIAVNVKKDGGFVNYSKELYGEMVNDDYQINNTQDLVIIRFADVLLMAAELKKDAAPLNLVRQRVGLGAVAYSDNALRNERRWELAFEGLRYFDLMRWGIAAQALNNQNGVEIQNDGVPTNLDLGDQVGRFNETGGFMPIPEAEIQLSSGVLKQTPGWE